MRRDRRMRGEQAEEGPIARAPAANVNTSGSTIHSISHGPVARSWPSVIASTRAATCWRTDAAQARDDAEIGLSSRLRCFYTEVALRAVLVRLEFAHLLRAKDMTEDGRIDRASWHYLVTPLALI